MHMYMYVSVHSHYGKTTGSEEVYCGATTTAAAQHGAV